MPGVRGFLAQLKINRQKKRRYICLLLTLSMLVASEVVWQLRLTGISMTDDVTCGLEEHTHTEECCEDVLICGKEEHTHTDECYETVLVLTCELEEHVHTEECYDEEGNLICGKEEHTHADGCYTAEQVLICDKEEHTHTEECYEHRLVCGLEEHTHTVMCFSDPSADLETASDWKATLPTALTGYWGIDAVAVAESQLGYTESSRNYILSDDGARTLGYTRYGAWYGIPYGDWCAMFVSFCLRYAGVPNSAFPYSAGCFAWMTKLQSLGLYASAADYVPTAGDVIFFNVTGDEAPDHVGLVTSVEYDAAGVARTVNTIEGNVRDDVERCRYSADDTRILGYGVLPQNPDTEYPLAKSAVAAAVASGVAGQPDSRVYTYSDESVTVTAVVPAEAGFPGNVELRVVPLAEGSESYLSAEAQTNELLGESSIAHVVYDIYFEADDAETEPAAGAVDISIAFNRQLLSGTDDGTGGVSVRVVHLQDGGDAEELEATAVISDDGNVESVDFSTDGFSTYDIVLMSADSTLAAGTYGSCTFAYNSTLNAFTSGLYSDYYNATSPLGVAGSFHLVGFGTVTLSSHCNGNILANTLNTGGQAFGTNNMTHELTYVVNYTGVGSNSGSSTSHILVIGSANTVTTTDNNSALAVNGTKLDKPKNVIQDNDSELTPFIDLDAVETYVRSLSASLGASSDDGVTKSLSDINNMSLTLNSPDGVAFVTLTATELARIGGNAYRLKMMGFQSSHDGSIIVNVDCAGCTSVTLPNATIWIDGVEQSTNETTTFSNGKVIWNFLNADGVTIYTNRMTGMILAPGATVTIQSNLNGTVIAENINVQAESHRTDFTGTVGAVEYVLPSTGGGGVLPYTVGGVALMLTACLLFIYIKRRREDCSG